MRTLGWVLLAAVFVVAAAPATARGAAETFTFPVAGTVTNPCTGEAVVFTGQVIVQASLTVNNNTVHVEGATTTQGVTGTTASGVKYVVSDQDLGSFSAGGTSAAEEASEMYTKVVRQGETDQTLDVLGGGDDYYMKMLIHMTFNASGAPTADVSLTSERCA